MKHEFARRLRRNSTEAERRLWAQLRRRQLLNARFRRQQPIGPYIVDFFCPAARLVVELDGGHHNRPTDILYDRNRTTWLEARGYTVLRFWNNDVMNNTGAVADQIWRALHTPFPVRSREPASPSRGE